VYSSPGSRPKLVHKNIIFWCQIPHRIQDFPLINTLGVLTPWPFWQQISFYCKPFLVLVSDTVQYTMKLRLAGVFSARESRLLSVFTTRECLLSGVYVQHQRVKTPVYSSPGSHFGHLGVVLPIFRNMQQSSKILQINCGLRQLQYIMPCGLCLKKFAYL
jgi:hypothetical protein